MLYPIEDEMNISTKTEYALRALYELALQKDNKPISIKEISSKHNLPTKYLEQLFRKLKRYKIIDSIHGAKGGYILARSEKDITLKDIMEAVDENYIVGFCDGDPQNHKHCVGLPCGFHDLWDEINDHIENYFANINLEYIVSRF